MKSIQKLVQSYLFEQDVEEYTEEEMEMDTEEVEIEESAGAPEEMIQQYVVTMLWATSDDNDEPLENNYNINHVAPEAMLKIRKDCNLFFQQARRILNHPDNAKHAYDDFELAGHDFFLTRNGHGAGFWDGDWAYGKDELTAIAESFGPSEPYAGDDGLIYVS